MKAWMKMWAVLCNVTSAVALVLFAMLWAPQAIAKSCNSLLVMVSGSGDDRSFAGISFRGLKLAEPVLDPLVDVLTPIYHHAGIDIIYLRYYFLNMEDVYKTAKNQIQEHRARCPDAAIGILGYSWGGDGAYKIAETSETRIQTLVTLDPVSLFDNPNPTRYRDGLFWLNNLISIGTCAATLLIPPVAAVVCPVAAVLITANVGVKITTEMLGNGNIPNPGNVDTWIHVWATGSWDGSDIIASVGAWLEQKHPDVGIRSNVSHDDLCFMYKASEKRLLQKLTNNVSTSENWYCKE